LGNLEKINSFDMNINKNLLFKILFFALLIASKNGFSQTPFDTFFKEKNIAPKNVDDAFYQIEKQGNGATPKRGDYVKLKYTGKLLDGTIFDASENDGFVFRLGYREVIQGWEMTIPQFKVGSKGTVFLPPNRAYGARALGKIPANAALIFEIEILDILNEAAYEKYNASLEQREKIVFEQKKKDQLAQDIKKITAYAAEKNIKTTSLASGLHYNISKKGKGEVAKNGDLITVDYEGFLLDGTAFDNTKEKGAFKFVLGSKKVMEGWEEGFHFFSKGSEGFLLIPSALAYKGTAIAEKNIPPNAVLIFKIKVKDITKK
jgi:FKBP-type peptidyl-prolyl cis-trans isomerase